MALEIDSTIFSHLQNRLSGDIYFDELTRSLYATDASVYQEMPSAVVCPKDEDDIIQLVRFASEHGIPIIPRAAGTSLAGQVVGTGIVVDISKYMNQILEINPIDHYVWVEPGVIRDELNEALKPHGLYFGPITATANRAMIGGMVGNNSCGQTSLIYGSTRDHTHALDCILSDGSRVTFEALDNGRLKQKLSQENLEGNIYRTLKEILASPENQTEILKQYPKKVITRRNTGYALDSLLDSGLSHPSGDTTNLCNILCGSEGTLAFTTRIKLSVSELPPQHDVVIALHFNSIADAMIGTQQAMKFSPTACELMDRIILECTADNIEQTKNRFFVQGDPAAILLVEFRGHSEDEALKMSHELIEHCIRNNIGYAHPVIKGPQTNRVWSLRKAGLGLLANIPGDKKAVACIEDTAVALEDLPEYIGEFTRLMDEFGQQSVYYAHAGHGELHLRPVLNLKIKEDRILFHQISRASAELVKKYGGSLSGEHGDGRARAEFIPLVYGQKIYDLLRKVKHAWDPKGIFNPGKIVDTQPMNTHLRYAEGQATPEFNTIFDYSGVGGILRAAEKCNGSGDCRKLPLSGGTMCPSYQATRNEKETTRARANTLRNFLGKNGHDNPFNHAEIKEVMDLCLSCKGCTAECPSNVDMASLKAEFLYQYQKSNPPSTVTKIFAHVDRLNALLQPISPVYNIMIKSALSRPIKKVMGIASQRSLPPLSRISLRKWARHYAQQVKRDVPYVYLFCDEFTNRLESHIGIKSIKLLNALGYQVKILKHSESGRAAISKGLLEVAVKHAERNVEVFTEVVSSDHPLIGIEPSAILTFVDEYPRLVGTQLAKAAKNLAKHTLTIDEFIYRKSEVNEINPEIFTHEKKSIIYHGHCHHKALANSSHTAWMMNLPQNYSVESIPSGCCGMAGSFGYEKDKYHISNQIGELVLMPAIRKNPNATIAASGTSCRHQIWDATGRKAYHPVEILYDALKDK